MPTFWTPERRRALHHSAPQLVALAVATVGVGLSAWHLFGGGPALPAMLAVALGSGLCLYVSR